MGMRRLLALGALGVLLALAAGSFDAEALWVPGVGLVLLALLSGLCLVLGSRGAAVEQELSALRVQEGEPLGVALRVRTGWLPLLAGEVRAPGGAVALSLRPGRREVLGRRSVVLARRGRHLLPAARLELRDPLGLAGVAVAGAGPEPVLVLPRVERVEVRGTGIAPLVEEAARAARRGAEAELEGLRPYRVGAPATRIVWPAFARGAGLVERRLVPEAGDGPLIVLDPSLPDSEEALDRAVRAVASLAVALARAGGCAVLLPGDRAATVLDAALTAWPALHARLALQGPASPPALGGREQRHPALLLVAARVPGAPPRALRGAGERVLVVPGELAGRASVLEVAGCRGYAVTAGARSLGAAA